MLKQAWTWLFQFRGQYRMTFLEDWSHLEIKWEINPETDRTKINSKFRIRIPYQGSVKSWDQVGFRISNVCNRKPSDAYIDLWNPRYIISNNSVHFNVIGTTRSTNLLQRGQALQNDGCKGSSVQYERTSSICLRFFLMAKRSLMTFI